MKMTVEDLIKRLQRVEDKTKTIWSMNSDNEIRPDIEVIEDTQSIEIYAKV